MKKPPKEDDWAPDWVWALLIWSFIALLVFLVYEIYCGGKPWYSFCT